MKTMLSLNLILAGGSAILWVMNAYDSGIAVFNEWDSLWLLIPICTAIFSALGLRSINWAKYAAFIFGTAFFGYIAYAIIYVSIEDFQRGYALAVMPFIVCMIGLSLGNFWACYANWKETQMDRL